MTSSLIIQKREYLENEKRYSKKENAILLYAENPFKSAAIIFYFIGTLSCVYNCDDQSCLHIFLRSSKERVMTYTMLDSEPGYKEKRPPPEHW